MEHKRPAGGRRWYPSHRTAHPGPSASLRACHPASLPPCQCQCQCHPGRPGAGRAGTAPYCTVLLVGAPPGSWLLPRLGQQDWARGGSKVPCFAGRGDRWRRPAYGTPGPGTSGPAAANHGRPATARLSQTIWTSRATARVASPLNCQAGRWGPSVRSCGGEAAGQ